MALCLPRKRRATSLATLPRTLSVASITNHSCVTSAGLALKVFMGMYELVLAPPRLDHDARLRFFGLADSRFVRAATSVVIASFPGEQISGKLLTITDTLEGVVFRLVAWSKDSSRLA